MQECDTLLIVGSNMLYSDYLPEEGAARGIQIDIDSRMLGFRYPTELKAELGQLEPSPERARSVWSGADAPAASAPWLEAACAASTRDHCHSEPAAPRAGTTTTSAEATREYAAQSVQRRSAA